MLFLVGTHVLSTEFTTITKFNSELVDIDIELRIMFVETYIQNPEFDFNDSTS